VDKTTLVDTGRRIVKALEDEGVPLIAALWVREISDTGGDTWLLWVAPKKFRGRSAFYLDLAMALATLQGQIGYFEISNVKVIEPNDPLIDELRRFGRVRPNRPRYLFSESLGRIYLTEAIILLLG
jgi:hypothetical protein